MTSALVKERALEFARRNSGLKALALVLACFLWWYVAGEKAVQIGIAVPLEIRNIPPGMAVTNKVDRTVDVRLEGPPSVVNNLTPKDLSVTVDLSSAKPGRDTIRFGPKSFSPPPGVTVLRVYPSSVDVVLEVVERRRIPVVARIGGGPEVRDRIAETVVDPPALEVEALPAEFSRIRTLQTEEVVPEVTRGVYTARVRVDLEEGRATIVGSPTVRVTLKFR